MDLEILVVLIALLSINDIKKKTQRQDSHSMYITWGKILKEGMSSHKNNTVMPVKVV